MDQLAINVLSSAWSQFVTTQAAKSALALVYTATRDIHGSINLSQGPAASNWFGSAVDSSYDMRTVSAVALVIALVICIGCICLMCVFSVVCCCVGAVARDALGSLVCRLLPSAYIRHGREWDIEATTHRTPSIRDIGSSSSVGTTVQGLAAVANSITIGGSSAVGEVAQQLGVEQEAVTEWWLTWQRAVRGPKRQQ